MVDQIEPEQQMAARRIGRSRAESGGTTSEDTSNQGSSERGDACRTALTKVAAQAAEIRRGIVLPEELMLATDVDMAEVLAAILEREHSRHEDLVLEQVQLEEQLSSESESG